MNSTDQLNRDTPKVRGAPPGAGGEEPACAGGDGARDPVPGRAEGALEREAKQPAPERPREARSQQHRGRKTPKCAGTARVHAFFIFIFFKRGILLNITRDDLMFTLERLFQDNWGEWVGYPTGSCLRLGENSLHHKECISQRGDSEPREGVWLSPSRVPAGGRGGARRAHWSREAKASGADPPARGQVGCSRRKGASTKPRPPAGRRGRG